MSRQHQRNGEKGKKAEEQKQERSSPSRGFPMEREPRLSGNPRGREIREVNLNGSYLNDLYERSSI